MNKKFEIEAEIDLTISTLSLAFFFSLFILINFLASQLIASTGPVLYFFVFILDLCSLIFLYKLGQSKHVIEYRMSIQAVLKQQERGTNMWFCLFCFFCLVVVEKREKEFKPWSSGLCN